MGVRSKNYFLINFSIIAIYYCRIFKKLEFFKKKKIKNYTVNVGDNDEEEGAHGDRHNGRP